MKKTVNDTNELSYFRLFETAQDGIVATDIQSKDIVFVNPSMCKLTGYTASELTKLKMPDLHPKEHVPAIMEKFKQQTQGKMPIASKVPVRKKDESIIYCDIVSTPIVINKRKLQVGFFRDVTERKIREEQLKESEKLFRESQQAAFIGSYKFDLTTNSWTSSEVLSKIMGMGEDDIKTFETWLERVHPDDRAMMENYFKNEVIGRRKKFNKEYRIVRKSDGEVRWVSGLGRVKYDEEEKPIRMVGTIMDITERKVAEEKNKWLASFPILDPNPVIEIEKDKGMVYFNPAAKKLFPDWKSKQKNHPFIAGLEKYFTKLNLNKKPLESREIKVNNRFFLQTISMSMKDYLRVYSTDITDLKIAQASILELKNRNESILESIGDAVVACNKRGIIQVFNKVAEEMTGITSTIAIGKHYKKVLNFVRDSDGKPSHDFIADVIKNKKMSEMESQVSLLREDGAKIPVADSASPVSDQEGNISGCVVIFRDMTRERKIDKAKTEFVSLASHQLRTPLSTINWYSEILLSEEIGKLNPKQEQYSKEVYHASQRMVALVNSLLNVSRLELGTFAVDPRPMNIAKIAETTIKELQPQITAKNLTIKEKYGKNATLINVDPKLMGMILQNLVSNSVKYTNSGGLITISLVKKDNNLIIQVEDNGIGIPKNQQKEIFGKLFRADNAKIADPDGSGLGLYIVKEIIAYTGGAVWFESTEGQGTKFYASIPLSGMKKKENNKQLI
jgi:PAS domain S-box-containing protein